jgi:hypothetical protein
LGGAYTTLLYRKKEIIMKRKVRIYKYTCDECGWEAYRAEIIPADLCSKCGSTKPPVVSTEDKEFEFSADVEKAAEYVKKLMAGADPEELDPRINEATVMDTMRCISEIFGSLGISVTDPVRMKVTWQAGGILRWI